MKFIDSIKEPIGSRVISHTDKVYEALFESTTLRPNIDQITDIAYQGIVKSGFQPCLLSIRAGFALENIDLKSGRDQFRYFYPSENTQIGKTLAIKSIDSKEKSKIKNMLESDNLYQKFDNLSENVESQYKFIGILCFNIKVVKKYIK